VCQRAQRLGSSGFLVERWEKDAIIDFHRKNPLEGYRRLTFMMLDADVVAVSPASVWRVLKQAGMFSRWKAKPSRKGTGFEQPLQPHQHWHIDVSYINVCGTLLLFMQCFGCGAGNSSTAYPAGSVISNTSVSCTGAKNSIGYFLGSLLSNAPEALVPITRGRTSSKLPAFLA
jgi:hypothetical protein